MNRNGIWLVILTFMLIVSYLYATYIPVSYSLFWFEGSAYYDSANGYVVLTQEQANQGGRAIPLIGIPASYGWFNFSFMYYIKDSDGNRADGFTFAFFANLSALTPISQATGGAEGFGTSKAYAIEFDEYQNDFDPTAPHIALINASYQNHITYNSSASFAFTANTWHLCNVSILYNGSVMIVLVWVDNQLVLRYNTTNPVIYGYFVFFSAGTGGYADGFYIKDFSVAFSYIPPQNASALATLIANYSWSIGSFRYASAYLSSSYSWSEGSFNAASASLGSSYSWSEGNFTIASESLGAKTRVLFPVGCKVIDLLSNEVAIGPSPTWLYTNVSYRLDVLIYSRENCSNCLLRAVFQTPFAKDIAGNGTAYLAIDNEPVSGSVYVLNNSVVIAYFRASITAFTYHYLYIYFGKTSSPNVGIDEIPIYVSSPETVNATIPLFLPLAIYDAYGTDMYGEVYLANGTKVGWGVLTRGNTSSLLVLLSVFPAGNSYLYFKIVEPLSQVAQSPSPPSGIPIFIPTAPQPPQTFFLDILDDLSTWTTVNSGGLSLVQVPVLVGSYSIKKDTYPDPNGGYEPITKALNFTASPCYMMVTYIYRSVIGASSDRVGLSDTSGNGYGFGLDHANNDIYIDRRSSWSATVVAKQPISYNPVNEWYQARLELCYINGEMLVTASAITFNGSKLIGIVGYRDTSPITNIDAFYILGGYTYYVDFALIAPVEGNATRTLVYDPSTEVNSVPCSYVEKYVPPATTAPPITYTYPSLTISVPNLTVTAPTIALFKIQRPSLFSPIGLLSLAFFLVIFIVYTRLFPWYKALTVSSAIMLIASIIWFGPIYMAIFIALLAIGLTFWKLWG